MADPVAWKVVEHGWKVIGPSGDELGTVHEVIGDANIDIFTGLTIHGGLLKRNRYIPSERVVEIVEGQVTVDLGGDELEALDETGPPGVV
jgi:uncharacterized protein YrrD